MTRKNREVKALNLNYALERLCSRNAPSGFERPAADAAAELLRPMMDEVTIDRLGNVIGVRRCGAPDAKKILLDAHLDEIGLIVTGVEDGFLRFRAIGGVDSRMLPDRELMILTEPPILGVVACLPPHVQTAEDTKKSIPITELYIDVGMTQARAEKAVPVGTPIVYRGSCFALGGQQMCGKAMDDRSCFVSLLRTAELLQDKKLDVDLYIMGSVQEETRGSGAIAGTYGVNPDCCVAVDVTHGRTPDGPKNKTFELGSGAAIGTGPNMTRWMTERMVDKAKAGELKHQMEVCPGHSGTNGWHMQVAREGIATAVISLPLKYMHTPIEVLALEDIESVAALLAAFTENLGKEANALCWN